MPNGTYLDNASTSFPKPDAVYEAVDRFLRECGGSPGRASHRKARGADEVVAAARSAAARIFGVKDPARVILTTNATEALNQAIQGILREGDRVVTSDLEHNSVARPLWRLKRTHGVDVAVVASDADGFVDPRRVEEAITNRTRLIACVHANNVLGTIQPVAEIGGIARRRGVPFLVDAAQSAGVVEIDVEAMGIDLLAFTGHKALFGPPGTGGLYVRERLELQPLIFGGTGVQSEELEPPAVVPEGYESGTPNAPGLAGLAAGIEFVEREGVARLGAHEIEINGAFMESARGVPGVRVYGPADPARKVGITLVTFDALDPADVGRLLDERFGIMVRSGLQCSALTHRRLGTERKGGVRFSFGRFNTAADARAAADALRELAKAAYRGAR